MTIPLKSSPATPTAHDAVPTASVTMTVERKWARSEENGLSDVGEPSEQRAKGEIHAIIGGDETGHQPHPQVIPSPKLKFDHDSVKVCLCLFAFEIHFDESVLWVDAECF